MVLIGYVLLIPTFMLELILACTGWRSSIWVLGSAEEQFLPAVYPWGLSQMR